MLVVPGTISGSQVHDFAQGILYLLRLIPIDCGFKSALDDRLGREAKAMCTYAGEQTG